MDVECTAYCPKCKKDKFKVFKREIREGVYENVIKNIPKEFQKKCQCGTNLERKV